MRLFAFYFPQFHEIPENNNWWGEGFTDWKLVRNAVPISRDQYQPREPLGSDYYDLSKPEVVQAQARLAQSYGLDGFNFYHYWFDGKVLLGDPLQNFYEDKSHQLEYCITWANETWTKQWVGDPTVLIEQSKSRDKKIWQQHFDYLLPFFKDTRYLTKEGKPVLCLYRPEILPFLSQYQSFFNEAAQKAGLKGIYWIGMESYSLANKASVFEKLDASIRFQPRDYFNYLASQGGFVRGLVESFLRGLPEAVQRPLSRLKYKLDRHQSFSYHELWDYIIESTKAAAPDSYQSVIVDWDNTARYGDKSKYFSGADPKVFQDGLQRLVDLESSRGVDLLFINAWNEWSEGAYLEADERHQYSYLEAIRAVNNHIET